MILFHGSRNQGAELGVAAVTTAPSDHYKNIYFLFLCFSALLALHSHFQMEDCFCPDTNCDFTYLKVNYHSLLLNLYSPVLSKTNKGVTVLIEVIDGKYQEETGLFHKRE